MLLRRDAADFFGMDPEKHARLRARQSVDDPPDDDYYGRSKMATALHHAARACNAEAVEFLLGQPGGAEPRRDGHGRTAYDYLKHLEDIKHREAKRGLPAREPVRPELIYAIFERHGWCLSSPEEIRAAATPLRGTDDWRSSILRGI